MMNGFYKLSDRGAGVDFAAEIHSPSGSYTADSPDGAPDGWVYYDSQEVALAGLLDSLKDGVANWALRLALVDIGKLASDVESAIDTIEDATEQAKARERWRYREGRVLKDHAITQFVAAIFGLDTTAIDALFVEAGKYQLDPDYIPD